MNILLCPDKFKGSISAKEICTILKEELLKQRSDLEITQCPLADGGDGSLAVLKEHLDIKQRVCETQDALGRRITAEYYHSEKTAFIELAKASGLAELKTKKPNPMKTSTYGTGLQIRDAIAHGITKVVLFLGGSATNDGGVGIAQALGFEFLDQDGHSLSPVGSNLKKVAKINRINELPQLDKIILCCDVNNPAYGPDGAAYVYAEQKGANAEEIEELDSGLRNLCKRIKEYNGFDASNLPGAGAAGGVAICLAGLLNADIENGLEMISNVSKLDAKIAEADVVISGEGSLDAQSLSGKVVSGVAEICKREEKKILLVVGRNQLSAQEQKSLGAETIYAVIDRAKSVEDAMANAGKYIRKIGKEIAVAVK
ncbi:MAG: glycerate kinase [Bacteroidota bacterium]